MTSKSAAMHFFGKSKVFNYEKNTNRTLARDEPAGPASQERNPIPGTPVATSSDAGDESFSANRVEVRLFLWA
jgi:hypothetical protein